MNKHPHPVSQASNDLRDCALQAARDLLLERNDAPVSDEQLLVIMYLRAFRAGVQTANAATAHVLDEVDRETGSDHQPYSNDSWLPEHIRESLTGARYQADLLEFVTDQAVSHV
jgi:hypothetical protein